MIGVDGRAHCDLFVLIDELPALPLDCPAPAVASGKMSAGDALDYLLLAALLVPYRVTSYCGGPGWAWLTEDLDDWWRRRLPCDYYSTFRPWVEEYCRLRHGLALADAEVELAKSAHAGVYGIVQDVARGREELDAAMRDEIGIRVALAAENALLAGVSEGLVEARGEPSVWLPHEHGPDPDEDPDGLACTAADCRGFFPSAHPGWDTFCGQHWGEREGVVLTEAARRVVTAPANTERRSGGLP